MPGLGPGPRLKESSRSKDVDGRDKPGHDKKLRVKKAFVWLLPPCLQPAAEIDGGQCAFVLARLLHGAVIELRDPGLVAARAVLRERKPHQAAGRLARHVIALEQHGAEHGLRLALAFLSREPEPARSRARIAW